MNNKVNSVLNSIEKIDNLIMEADVSVSDAMSDVYSKQFKMEGNVTEDYINHEYYQESVIAGILIGGGIIAVLATAIVLITKHVKKSASGDPEKKNDTSTAAGVSLDKPEEFNKKVEQLKSELEKAGGKLTISDVGFDASKLKQKYEMIKELCGYAENFLKGTEDDEINGALTEFNNKLEEINGIDYKLSGEVDVTSASLDEIKSLAGPIQQMTANLEKVSKEFEKRSKENKNANTGEMDDAKKERFEKLKEGLNQINKGSTDLGKSVDNEFSIIRKYFEAVSKAAKEKAKPAQAESEKKSESEKSQETPQNTDILKQKIYPITSQWASTSSNSDSKHPGAKLTADEAYNIIDSIHDNVVNHRALNVLDTLKAKANENPTNAILIKNLIESTIDDQNVFETDGKTINDIKSGLSELENIAANAPSEEPKKDESENSQEINLSQEDIKNIAEFANTFVLQGKNKKGTTTMPVDDIKKTLSEILPYIKSHQYTNATTKMRELFNEQDNIDLKSIFMDLMIEAKNPLFKGEIPKDKTISDMKKSISIKANKTSDTQTDEEPKTDEPKSDDTDTKSLPTVSELINDVDNVDKIVEAYNQTASPSDKIDSGDISSFKNAQNQIKIDNLEDVFNEFIKIYNIDLNMPISKSVFKTLASVSEDVNSCHGFESNLNDSFLSIRYEKYQNDPSRKQQMFDEAKTYAEMRGINVTLTKPDGTHVEVGTKSDEPKTEPEEKKNNVITITKDSDALYDLIDKWKSPSELEAAFTHPIYAEKRIKRASNEEHSFTMTRSTRRSRIYKIKIDSTDEEYINFVSALHDTLKNINNHPELLEKISDDDRKNLAYAFEMFFYRNKEAIDPYRNNGMWPKIFEEYDKLYSKYKQGDTADDTQTDEDKEDDVPNDNDDTVNEDSVNNDYIIDDFGIWYICDSMFPDEYTLRNTINNIDDFNENINDIENRKTQTDKITNNTVIEDHLNYLIRSLDIIEKGISFDNITNVAPLFVRVLKVIKEYTENSISISDNSPLYSKVTDIRNKVDELISEYSALKPATPTDQNDSENTETTDTADESTPETSQNTDESSNQNGSENSDETKKQPEPKIEYPTISGFNGLSDLVSELVSSGSIKRIVKNKKSGVDIDKLIAKAYNAEKTLQNKGTLTGDNAVQVLSNSNDEEEVLEKINTALTNIMSDIKHFNNLTSQSKTKLVATFEIFLNRNKFSGNGTIIDLKRNISKTLSFIKAKSNVNTGSAITAAQDTTTPQNDIDSNQQDQNSPQTQQQSQPESSPQPEPKSDDTDTKSVPTVSELIGNGDVDKVVEAYNQTASPSNKIDSGEISWFKDYQDQIKANNLGDVFNEFIKIHNIDLNGPMSKSSFGMLSSAAADSISCYKNRNDLNGFLLDQYSRFRSYPSRMQRIFDEAKKYAEMERILVILTDPNGEQVIPGTKSDVKSTSDTTDDTKPKTLRWFIENPEISVDYVNKNLLPKDDKYVSPIFDYVKKAMTTVRDNNLINVLEKYGNDTGKYKLDDELTWDNAEELSSDAKTLEYIHKYKRNDINEYLKNEYSDNIMTDSMKDRKLYLAKAYVELHGGPNELLKPDGTMVSVTPAKTSTQSADNTQPKNTNQDIDNTPPTQTEMAKLKNHILVHDVVTEANQRDEDGVPMITNDMETELKNASEEHLMDFIGHFITELTGNHTMIETIPFTRRNIITLAAYAKQANKILKSQNNLRDFLTQQYGYYKDPAQQEYIYKMAKLFAQDYNISVVLTDPSGKKEYINPTTNFN